MSEPRFIDTLNLTAAEKAKLIEELTPEFAGHLVTAHPEQAKAHDQVVVEAAAVGVYTNISNGDLILSDLGQLSGDKKTFTPEVIPYGSTVNLAEKGYSSREITRSRSLMLALSKKLAVAGKASIPGKTAITRLAEANPEGVFNDPDKIGSPTSKNEYDVKLAELAKREEQEDIDSLPTGHPRKQAAASHV